MSDKRILVVGAGTGGMAAALAAQLVEALGTQMDCIVVDDPGYALRERERPFDIDALADSAQLHTVRALPPRTYGPTRKGRGGKPRRW